MVAVENSEKMSKIAMSKTKRDNLREPQNRATKGHNKSNGLAPSMFDLELDSKIE